MLPSSIVSSVSQLGARKHSHPHGPQMVSLLRSSHVVDSLVLELEATLAHHRPVSSSIAATGGSATVTSVATVSHVSLGTSTALVRALVSLAALDIGFVQNLTQNIKVVVNSLNLQFTAPNCLLPQPARLGPRNRWLTRCT